MQTDFDTELLAGWDLGECETLEHRVWAKQ